jgi:hypothetical protein
VEVKKNVKNIFLSMCDVKVFLTFTFTEYGTVLTTILPILFLYLNTVIVTAGDFGLLYTVALDPNSSTPNYNTADDKKKNREMSK